MNLNPFRRGGQPEQRDGLGNPNISIYDAILQSSDGLLDFGSGIAINPTRAMRVVAFFACVRVLADTIAALDLDMFKRAGLQRTLVSEDDDPRAYMFNVAPNPNMTAFQLKRFIVACLAVFGNAYAWIESDEKGQIIGIWPITPTRIKRVDRTDGSRTWLVQASDNPDDTAVFDDSEIIPFHGLGLDIDAGLAPYQQLRDELGISVAATDYAGRMFTNFAVPGGVYSTDKQMNDEQFATFMVRQKAAHEGLKNTHKMAVLPPGMTYTETNFDPSNLQMVEARTFQFKIVAMAFGIPPRMLGINDGTSSYSSVEQDSINFVTHTLRPWLVNIQQTFRRSMLSFAADRAIGLFCEFDTTPLLVPDSISRAKIDQSDVAYGIRVPNEIREARGLPPRPGGDTPWMPANLTPLREDGTPINPGFAAQPDPLAAPPGLMTSDDKDTDATGGTGL